jgi:PPOX class probable F420-dependent enzyme
MTVDLTHEVSTRLTDDHHGWLTTVARSGLPIPKLVWFFFDGADLAVYTMPSAAKVRHVTRHPQVSLNLDSNGTGSGIIVVGGTASVAAVDVDPREDGPYWAKYREEAAAIGLTEAMAQYSTRLKITPTKVWTTPTET